MERVIKFRAWNPATKKMFIVSGIDLSIMSVISDTQEWRNFKSGPFGEREQKDCHIMQFTGLLDKNGKEIYEGDILQFVSGRKGAVVYDTVNVRVEHRKCKLLCFSISIGKHYGPIESTDEVIGNIHENPELLNG